MGSAAENARGPVGGALSIHFVLPALGQGIAAVKAKRASSDAALGRVVDA
ncbi:MAG: hypothetical protein AAGC67_12440 [Myxococcota bacterium]